MRLKEEALPVMCTLEYNTPKQWLSWSERFLESVIFKSIFLSQSYIEMLGEKNACITKMSAFQEDK